MALATEELNLFFPEGKKPYIVLCSFDFPFIISRPFLAIFLKSSSALLDRY